MFAARFPELLQLHGVALFDRLAKRGERRFDSAESRQHLLAIVVEDLGPERTVAGGDPRRV